MRARVVLLAVALVVPVQAHAASYVVQAGDTLTSIAQRYHVTARSIAAVNNIRNLDLLRIGRVLFIPETRRTVYYRVRWGDTLLGIASRYGLSVAAIRSMNPELGAYPLAGQRLQLCTGCVAPTTSTFRATVTAEASGTYRVVPGDTLSGIAARYGVSPATLLLTNGLTDANRIVIGTILRLPASAAYSFANDPSSAQSLIYAYARRYGLDPSLPLAIAWQESGFNQNMVSRTGAIGVMQVEPYTAAHIGWLLGRSFNLWSLDDNIHAGVFWLSQLLAYYGGDQRMATAAYYEGTRNIALHGLFLDTVQYVNNVAALQSRFRW